MFSRRHYEAIASVLARQINIAPDDDRVMTVRSVAYDFAGTFKAKDPRFDSVRFLRACSVDNPRLECVATPKART